MKHRVIRSVVAVCAAAAPVVGLASRTSAATPTIDGCTATSNKPTLSNGIFSASGSGTCTCNRHRKIFGWFRAEQNFNLLNYAAIVQGQNTPGAVFDSLPVAAIDQQVGPCTGGVTGKVFFVTQIGDVKPVVNVDSEPLVFSCK